MKAASLLIQHGALVNIPGHGNDTPLHDAVANNHCNVASLLLQSGADINIRLDHMILYCIVDIFRRGGGGFVISSLVASDDNIVEPLIKATPDVRTPLYKGQFTESQMHFFSSIKQPLR